MKKSSFLIMLIIVALTITGCARFESPAETDYPFEDSPFITRTIRAEEAREAEEEAEDEVIERAVEEETAVVDDADEIMEAADKITAVEAEIKGENVVLTIQESILFETLSAEVKRTAHPVLDEIAKLIQEFPDRMALVAGHADDRPTRTEQFPSNWDLSAQRAVNVVKYIRHLPELDRSRLIAAGFSRFHPVAPNDTPENRRLNRRVEIILLPPWGDTKEISLPEKL